MFVGELEGLNQSESLVNWSTYWQVIDGNLTKVLLLIDDEKTSVGDTLIFLEDAIFAWNGMVSICQEWNVHFSKTPLFTWSIDPSQVTELAVSWASNNFAANVSELLHSIWECNNLSWAHKCAENI